MKKTILCLVALSLIFAFGCGKKENLVLAKVGERTITLGAFQKADSTMDERFLPKTNDLVGKKELLDVMINKEVMALKALTGGYDKEEWFVRFWDKYKPGYAVAALENNYIIKKVKVTDQEVKDYFDKMHYVYDLSQILVANEDEAISIREQLMGGADFAELARKYSLGSEAVSGGELGNSAIGSMFYWVEDALFQMKEGDISQPLRTPEGWSILKVQRIQKITPEKDIVYARKKLESNEQKKLLQEMKTKIEKDIGLVIYPDAVNLIYSNLPTEINPEDLMSYKVTRDNAPKLEIPEQYHNMILAQYADGSYTIKDYMKIFNEMDLPMRPNHRQGKQGITNSIHRRIWDQALPVYAEKTLKVLEIPEVAKDIANRKEMILVKYLYDSQIAGEVVVSDLEVQDYYKSHKNEILSPERRSFSIILLGDKAKAEEVAARAKKGESFEKLVKEFAGDPAAGQTVESTGLTPRGEYPDYDEVAFSLPTGAISDAFQVPRGWAVIRIEEVEAPQTVSYETAAPTAKQYLTETRTDKLLKDKLAKWRKDYTIKIYERNLRKAELARTRPSDAEIEQKARAAQKEMEQQQQQQREVQQQLKDEQRQQRPERKQTPRKGQ